MIMAGSYTVKGSCAHSRRKAFWMCSLGQTMHRGLCAWVVTCEPVLLQAWRHRWRHMRYKSARDSRGLPHIDWNRYHLQVGHAPPSGC